LLRWDNPNRRIQTRYMVGKTLGSVCRVLKLRDSIIGYILDSKFSLLSPRLTHGKSPG
jgi:hypothetical protein